MKKEVISKFIDYLEYQKHYSHYTIINYRKDLDCYAVYLEKEGLNLQVLKKKKDFLDILSIMN